MPFNVQRPVPGVATIEVGKAIDVHNADALEARCKRAIGDGVRHIVFDLTETMLVDAEGLGVLIALYERLGTRSGDAPAIVLANVQRRARMTFEITRTERLFAFADSVEDAVERLH